MHETRHLRLVAGVLSLVVLGMGMALARLADAVAEWVFR